MTTQRTHDEFYANESHKHNVKESFKYMGDKVLKSLAGGGGSLPVKKVALMPLPHIPKRF